MHTDPVMQLHIPVLVDFSNPSWNRQLFGGQIHRRLVIAMRSTTMPLTAHGVDRYGYRRSGFLFVRN
jgi:hypothetical protein